MYEYIKGELSLLTPTYSVIEAGGIGYHIQISLQTYSRLNDGKNVKLFLHQVVREDANLLYGFFDEEERGIFRLLINVSGVGPSTGMMVISSLSSDEIRTAILKEDINTLKGVKGIGLKTAQRIIVDLRDKVSSTGTNTSELFAITSGTQQKEEALSALIALGFAKAPAEKTLDKFIKQNSNCTVEELIKAALKQL